MSDNELHGCAGLPDLLRGQRQGSDGRMYEGFFEQRSLWWPDPPQLSPDEYRWSPDEPP